MNLHLTTDEKFLDNFANNTNEYVSSENIYWVFTNESKLHNIDPTLGDYSVFHDSMLCDDAVIKKTKNIYLHGIKNAYNKVLKCFADKKEVKIYWLFYGFEVFSLNEYHTSFLLPETLSYYKRKSDYFLTPSINPVKFRRNLINFKHYSKEKRIKDAQIKAIINKVHYFCHFIKEDFERYVKPLNANIQFLEWLYFRKNEHFVTHLIPEKKVSKQKILFGNSASIYNNHIDGLQALKKYDLHAEIITPLGYSGDESYQNTVAELGHQLFKEDFKPLSGFLPRKTYFELLRSIDLAIFFNKRSQAGGNIFWLIFHLKPIILEQDSTFAQLLNRIGVKIFSLDELNTAINRSEILPILEENKRNLALFLHPDRQKLRYQNLLGQ